MNENFEAFHKSLIESLNEEGTTEFNWSDLNNSERQIVRKLFPNKNLYLYNGDVIRIHINKSGS